MRNNCITNHRVVVANVRGAHDTRFHLSYHDQSFLKLFTGFVLATFNDLILTVIIAMSTDPMAVIRKGVAFSPMRKAKVSSHLSITNQAIGLAIIHAIKTSRMNSRLSRRMIWLTFAPNTLRIPISRLLRSAEKAESPKSPSVAMSTAIPEN